MYRVTIYNGTTETVIHEPSTDPDDAHLYECSLVQGSSGEIDSLSFTITPNNPGYEKLNPYSTFIEVVDLRSKGEAAIFSGRVLSVSPQMEESGLVYKNIVCEDRLGYLCDSIQPYTTMDTYTVRGFLELLLNNHNSQVEDYKKIYVGTVSFETSSGNVTKSLNYQTTWEAITGKLLELGGEIQLYTLNGLLYIDYVTELGTMGDQTIEIAKNMRSLEQDKSPTDIITRLIPLGDYLEEQEGDSDDRERLTIASVNGGRTYIDDDDAIAEYGIIAGTVVWEDVTIASNLLEKGQQWLKDQSINETVSLSAYDLYAAGIDPDVIERYNYYLTYNPLIGVNKWYRVAQKTINVIDPTDVSFTMGDQSTSLSSTVKRTGQSAADAAAAINANLSKTVATLIAGNAIIQYLQAEVAEIETLYVTKEYVDELVANEITAAIINAGFLTADSAVITDLTAFAANIYTLLGGEGAFGELQSVHLTTDNAVIDTAVIINAIAGTILADIIEADYIDTDLISIHSEDGTLWIDGSTILIYDADGNPRIQIGLDELGDYNLALWDEDGNCMWNATGATEYGLNDGIIRDITVADDANISGYKLNIEEICSIINSNGAYEIDASSVTINGQTLDAWYGVITEEIEGLEGLTFDGLISVEPWFCLWYSDTVSPDDEAVETICGQFLCGQAICGRTGSAVWVDYDLQTEEGLYKWVKWKGYYSDGHTEWSIPYCLTDGYIRTVTGVLQTELEVVQGWISERVWYTEIIDAVNDIIETDVWAELNIWLNGIELEVGDMRSEFTDQYETLETQVSQIVLTTEGITSRVESTEQRIGNLEYQIENLDLEGVSYFETYFCLWDSALEAPPDDADWTLTDPQAGLGEYKWVRYLLYYEDGHTEWTTPYCLTDDYIKTEISLIEQTATSISESVNSVITWLGDDYYSSYGLSTCINQYVENSRAEIMLEVSSEYATTDYVTDLLNTLELDGVVSIETYYAVTESSSTPPETGGESYTETFTRDVSLNAGATGISTTISVGSGAAKVVSCTVDNDNVVITDAYISGTSVRVVCRNPSETAQSFTITVVVQYGEGVAWSTDYPEVPDGSFLWVAMLLTYADGHTAWTEPFCVTADTDLSSYATITYTDAQIKALADDTQASIDILAQEMTSMGDEWSVSVAEIRAYVDSEISNITLSVSGTLGGEASITIQAGGNTSTDYLDLSLVREVFAAEDSSVTIEAGLIQFGAGTLVIQSEHFRLDENQNLYIDTKQFALDYEGNATFSGHLSAPSGTIGGWEIGTYSLYNGTSSMTSTTNGTFLGSTTGIRQYKDGDYINITEAALTNGNSSNDKAELTNGALRLTHSGTYLGSHGTSYYANEPTKFGLSIDAEYNCNYISFARKGSSSASVYSFDILINYGLDPDKVGYSEDIIFYGSTRCVSPLSAGSIAVNAISPLNDYINIGVTASNITIGSSNSTNMATLLGKYTTIGGTAELDLGMSCKEIDVGSVNGDTDYVKIWGQDITVGGGRSVETNGAVTIGDESCTIDIRGRSVSLGSTGASVTIAGSSYSSDQRLKASIEPLESFSLDNITPVSFKWKSGDDRTHYGYIAQEVQPYFPELVSEGTDGMLGLAYTEIIPLLHLEIKQLKERIMQLESERRNYNGT